MHKPIAAGWQNRYQRQDELSLALLAVKAADGVLRHARDVLCPTPVIPLSMTHPEDDDQDLADHGTVIMDRKAASGIPRPAANSKSRSRPSPPPIVPAAGAMPTTPATPPASTGLPVLPPSISGVTPSQPAPAASSSANKRLAALVAFGSFTVVFVIGALIMILIRVARDSADEPRPNGAVQTKPVNSSRTTSK